MSAQHDASKTCSLDNRHCLSLILLRLTCHKPVNRFGTVDAIAAVLAWRNQAHLFQPGHQSAPLNLTWYQDSSQLVKQPKSRSESK
jgi:hypothetical protein